MAHMRRETRSRLVLMSAVALLLVTQHSDSHVLLVFAWFYFPIALVSQIRFADTSPRLFGPVWFRRGVVAAIALLWVAIGLTGPIPA
jgi:hypothetical protein